MPGPAPAFTWGGDIGFIPYQERFWLVVLLGSEMRPLVRDNGLVGIAELQIPFVQAGDLRVSATPFANVGVGWNHGSDRAMQRNTLAYVGAGLQIGWEKFRGRINYAFPLLKGQRDPISFELFFRYGI